MFVEQLNSVMPIVKPNPDLADKLFIIVCDNKFIIDNGILDDAPEPRLTHWEQLFWRHACMPQKLIQNAITLASNELTNYFLLSLSLEQLEELQSTCSLTSVSLRAIGAMLNSDTYCLAAMAMQVFHWLEKHRFCGCCGAKLEQDSNERALVCSNCGNREYIKVHPCIIVKITKGDEILLCRSPHFRPGLYSNVAGFIEPGESAEKAVWREVKEEVGIDVKNIRYLGSQTWPFPSQIMLAFEADYDSGDIVVDGVEVVDAKWFSAKEVQEQFVDLITSFSISGWLVKKYLDDMSQE